MKTNAFKLYIIIVFSLISTYASADGDANFQFLDQQRENYVQGILSEEVDLITQHYSDDIRLMPEASPTILGGENARLYFKKLFSRFNVNEYKRVKLEYLDMKGFVSELGEFEMKMTNQQGELRAVEGKYINLWEKGSNNTFKLVADIWNYSRNIDFKSELIFENIPSKIMALEAHLPINTSALFELAAYDLLLSETLQLNDSNVLVHIYSDDARILPNYHAAVEGRLEIDAYWRKHSLELPSFEKLQNRTNLIHDLGSYVIQFSAHIANWRSGEYSGVSTGKHLRIWKRGTDGRLRLHRVISAYDA